LRRVRPHHPRDRNRSRASRPPNRRAWGRDAPRAVPARGRRIPANQDRWSTPASPGILHGLPAPRRKACRPPGRRVDARPVALIHFTLHRGAKHATACRSPGDGGTGVFTQTHMPRVRAARRKAKKLGLFGFAFGASCCKQRANWVCFAKFLCAKNEKREGSEGRGCGWAQVRGRGSGSERIFSMPTRPSTRQAASRRRALWL